MNALIEFCDIFCQTQPYPLHIFQNEKNIWQYPATPFDFISPLKETFFSQEKTAFLYQTPESLLFGGVFNKKRSILLLLGPASITPPDPELLHQIMTAYSIGFSKRDALVTYLNRNSGYTFMHFKSILHQLCYFLNHEISSSIHGSLLFQAPLEDEINKKNIEISSNYDNTRSFRLAYEFEQRQLSYVKTGNVDAARLTLASSEMHIGILASSSLRQLKNLLICTITLVTRAAIEGGLSLETAYQLSDFYIQKTEKALSAAVLNEIMDTMYLDFTKRTQKVRYLSKSSNDLFQCIQFIRENVYRSVTVKDVAEYAGLSVSQLERRFKTTLGFLPGYFITRCKLEEAKELLAHTNKSLNEISQILDFSSQAYLSNVFKKKYGISPKKYRQISLQSFSADSGRS